MSLETTRLVKVPNHRRTKSVLLRPNQGSQTLTVMRVLISALGALFCDAMYMALALHCECKRDGMCCVLNSNKQQR